MGSAHHVMQRRQDRPADATDVSGAEHLPSAGSTGGRIWLFFGTFGWRRRHVATVSEPPCSGKPSAARSHEARAGSRPRRKTSTYLRVASTRPKGARSVLCIDSPTNRCPTRCSFCGTSNSPHALDDSGLVALASRFRSLSAWRARGAKPGQRCAQQASKGACARATSRRSCSIAAPVSVSRKPRWRKAERTLARTSNLEPSRVDAVAVLAAVGVVDAQLSVRGPIENDLAAMSGAVMR